MPMPIVVMLHIFCATLLPSFILLTQVSKYEFTIRVENSVDLDQMASLEAS